MHRKSREICHHNTLVARAGASVAIIAMLLWMPPVTAGPLSDITTRIAPPPADQDAVDEAKKTDADKAAADAPTTKLDSVVVTGHRTHEDSEAEKVRKALEQKKPKPGPDPDLNHAGKGMKEMAEWTTDPDSYRNHPGDPTTKFNAPVGDETAGCGADITKGCEPHR